MMTASGSQKGGTERNQHRSDSERLRRVRESTVKKKILGLAVFAIVVLSLVNALFGERGVLGVATARAEHETLATEIDSLRRGNQDLAREIHALRTDPLAIERRAREVLGMARPEEVTVQIDDPGEP